MSFSGNNFAGSIQPHLSSYINGSNHFQKNYCSSQTPTYPLLHSAAVAAMAAAAAGYSHFGSRLNTGPLNLTSVPGYRTGLNFGDSDENRNAYYQSFGLQANNPYASAYANGFPGVKHTVPLSFPNSSSAFQLASSDSNAHSAFLGAAQQSGLLPPSVNPCSSSSEPMNGAHLISRTPRSHGHKAGYKAKLKKAINAQELASRKRQEFDELVKARTDKLLSGYPLTTAESMPSVNSSSLSISNPPVTKDSPESPNYKKLIEAVLDMKKSALLRSPSVVSYLETQQRCLAEFKRRTELFCVDAK